MHKKIADIHNNTAATGKYPKHYKSKKKQPKGPISNHRPTMKSLYNKKNQFKITLPISQAGYCKNRSATKHEISTKLITKGTISSTDETTYLLLAQAFTKYLRLTLVFMKNSALRKKFSFCFSRAFC